MVSLPGKVQPSHLGEEVPVTLTSLPAVKAQGCWIRVRAGHRACTYQGPDEWPLHCGEAGSQSPFSELASQLVAGLGPMGGHLCALVEAPGLPSGPGDLVRLDQRNQSARMRGLDRAFLPTLTLPKAHHPCPLCLPSKFNINQRVFGNFSLTSRKKRFCMEHRIPSTSTPHGTFLAKLFLLVPKC